MISSNNHHLYPFPTAPMSIVTKGVAIITGAASGIGRAVAIRLARDGFSVSLNDLHTSKEKLDRVADEISSINGKVISIIGDVSKEKDVQNIVDKTVKELGSLNVVSRTIPILLSLCLDFPQNLDGGECWYLPP